ncbi:chemotaxis response regulator protein-glutamate methylesterase [Alkaliphilus pronyensis]|uniref:Protein-glutamate methylesterase/protein-glutamine glutaminase n=1 Tax=Alkaliphilus pronyensis TaxID=1482732 RepID=A0A6I0FI68_9FIRM|nr:chemotaxis response regulator protein-glutamate methylesterase [Alkaliphilus pronyensis]KAB3535861.1 chemotaxis response regulator protein-glutamate methylesterase [Alkaliphilus pronyensis]
MTEKTDPIKVLIVDDSAFIRKILTDIINSDPDLKVVGFARNGKDAIEKIAVLQPDVVTMDVEMPVMNGILSLELIMKKNPIPVVMLSSLTSDGAKSAITALELGAVDFIEKPSSVFGVNAETLKNEVIFKIKAASKAKLEKKRNTGVAIKSFTLKSQVERGNNISSSIIAIGTSTGGPRALQAILPLLPASINASILIVQHMPPGFTRSLAERLDTISQIKVKEAEDKEELLPGVAYIAPGDFHMAVEKTKGNRCFIKLDKTQPVSGHRPSADVLFSSVSKLDNEKVLAVIMTGMGSDGTNGLRELKDSKKSPILAQDEESCVVYGMPKSAVKAGIVDDILPLNKIAKAIINRLEVL